MQQEPLWQTAFREGTTLVNRSSLHPVYDLGRIAKLLLELYIVGERPSTGEMDTFLREFWPGERSINRKQVVELWSKILATPRRQAKVYRHSSGAEHFLLLDEICERDVRESVSDRLVRQVHAEARAYASSVVASPGSAESEEAARRYAFAAHALEVWGASRDPGPHLPWSPYMFCLTKCTDPVRRLERYTRAGVAREEERIRRLIDEREREFPPGSLRDEP